MGVEAEDEEGPIAWAAAEFIGEKLQERKPRRDEKSGGEGAGVAVSAGASEDEATGSGESCRDRGWINSDGTEARDELGADCVGDDGSDRGVPDHCAGEPAEMMKGKKDEGVMGHDALVRQVIFAEVCATRKTFLEAVGKPEKHSAREVIRMRKRKNCERREEGEEEEMVDKNSEDAKSQLGVTVARRESGDERVMIVEVGMSLESRREGDAGSQGLKMLKTRNVHVSFDTVRDKNLMQLKKLHMSIFPVFYRQKFYTDALSSGEFTKLAYYADLCVGSIACRLEKDKCGGDVRVYIMTLGVLAPYRRMGIGSGLLSNTLELCEQDPSIVQVYLHVQVNSDAAIEFYKQFDFEITETVKNYYKHIEPRDAFVLSKTLLPSSKAKAAF